MNGEVWPTSPPVHQAPIYALLRLSLSTGPREKGADIGACRGALASACRKVIALTGTLIGGYAEHLRPLLFRLSAGSLVRRGWQPN